MPTNIDLTAHDLRSSAQEQKRQSDTKSKWEPKWAVGGLDAFRLTPSGKKRPARRCSQKAHSLDRMHNERSMRRASLNRKQDTLATPMAVEDISTDEYSSEGSLDDDIEYSFDARGPSNGSHVLGAAVSVAVERFESRVTDKLIQDEYEVLTVSDEPLDYDAARLIDEDDEDFEIV